MKRSGRLKDIAFYVGDKLYRAKVFVNRPTAIIIPDQNVLAYTNLGPKPDSSTEKNRYRKIVNPTEKEEVRIDVKLSRKRNRTIFDETGRLNNLTEVKYPEGEPFRCDCTSLVIAIREYTNPR